MPFDTTAPSVGAHAALMEAVTLDGPASAQEMRQRIVGIEAALNEEIAKGTLPDSAGDTRLHHYFIPGGYARELTIPAGCLIVGRIHKAPCFNFVSKGSITVVTEEGRRHIEAPAFFISEAGVKRVGFTHTETVWTTMHVTDSLDVDKMVDHLTVTTYAEFDRIALERKRKHPCLSSE